MKRIKAVLLALMLVPLLWPPPSATTGVVQPPSEAASLAAWPFDIPQSFIVSGGGELRIRGPHCCDRPLRVLLQEMAYHVFPDGRVIITRFRANIQNFRATIRVIGLPDEHRSFFCNTLSNVRPIEGLLDRSGNLMVAVGAARVFGITFPEPPEFLPSAFCTESHGGGTPSGFTETNSTPLTGLLDPQRDIFRLEGTFTVPSGDGDFDIRFNLSGNYVNRPPVAVIGVEGPRLPFLAQGGCPPLSGINPPTTQANDPRGLLLTRLRSLSSDPDGEWARADILFEQWFHSRAGGVFEQLGRGREIGPRLFEFGAEHRIALVVTDRVGARSSTGCTFIVVDTMPPLVIPPERLTTLCSERGGVSLRTSRTLRDFLSGASASDNSDPAPMLLPPQIADKDISDQTLFPVDLGQSPNAPLFTLVMFRFRDRHGNIGSATSGVRVVDRQPPSLRVELSPNVLQPTFQFVTIRANISAADVCTSVRVILESIVPEPPPPPLSDLVLVMGAGLGTDDREFQLRAAPAVGPNQQAMDRIYKVTYLATDQLGNQTRTTTEVRVRATGQ